MKPRSPVRQALTLVAALAIVGGFLWFRSQPPVMSGTKSTFSFVGVGAVPAGGAGGPTRVTTTTPTAATTTAVTATGGR